MSDLAPETTITRSDLARSEEASISDIAHSDQADKYPTLSNNNENSILPSNDCQPLTPNPVPSTTLNKQKVQLYHAHTCSVEFDQYKKDMGVDAVVYTATTPEQPRPESNSEPYILAHDFISLLTFPANPESISYNPIASNACNNKEDILTQSQMFKAEDASKFIACQEDEINGLQKFDVMDICPISSLPPKSETIKLNLELQTKKVT
jgi:hypothetical protein